MRLAGLTAAEFSLLFTGAALFATICYLLSQRRRAAILATMPLWEKVLGRRRTPFRKLLSLFLQIAVLFLLALTLGDPRLPPAGVSPGVTLVLLCDTSASMGVLEGERTRLEQAVELIGAVGDALGPRDQMMLLAMDDGVEPLTPMTGDAETIRAAARRLQAGAVAEDFARGLQVAVAALNAGAEDTVRRIAVLSDHFHEGGVLPEGLELLQVAVGEPGANLSMSAFDVRLRSGAQQGHEVFAEVQNHGPRPRSVRLAIHTAGELLGEELLEVPARGSLARSYFLKPVEAEEVMATITASDFSSADRFPQDDRAYALVPRRVRRSVLLVTASNLYLEKALGLNPLIDLRVVAPKVFDPSMLGGVEAAVFDGLCPASNVPALYFQPGETPGCPFTPGPEVQFPALLPLREHPISEGVSLVDVQIKVARHLIPEAGDAELLADSDGPLALARERDGLREVAFGFDIAKSDLPLRIAFPLLVHRTLTWFLGEPDDRGGAIPSVGQRISLPGFVDPAAVEIQSPSGGLVLPLWLGGRAILVPREPGFFHLRQGPRALSIPVNFYEPSESALAGDRVPSDGRVLWNSGAPPKALLEGFDKTEVETRAPVWPRVLLAAAWLLLFDWIFFCFRMLF